MKKTIKTKTEEKKQQKPVKTNRIEKILFWSIFALLIGTIIYIGITMILGGTWRNNGTVSKGFSANLNDLLLCVFALILLFAPSILQRNLHIKVPSLMYGLFVAFLFLSVYLGHIESLYRKIPYYDSFVHTFSSIVIGLFSMSILKILSNNGRVKIEPWFILLFAISFTIMAGVLWEIWEFVRDTTMGMNMQRTTNIKTGEPYVGLDAIKDTMKDLILDTVGAIIAGVIGSFAVSRNEKNFNALTLSKIKNPGNTKIKQSSKKVVNEVKNEKNSKS